MLKEVGTPRYLSLVASIKGFDEAVHKELLGDIMAMEATNYCSGPRCQDTILRGVDAQTRFAYLEKSEGSGGIHEIIDFLSASHIHYALTASPTIYTSLIEQFWQTAALCIIDEGVLVITETIDRKVKITVSEASNRRLLKLEDSEGIPSLPTAEIFEQLALIGIRVLEKDLQQTKKTYSTALIRLILRVKKLEKNVKTGKARRRARIVISKDEDAAKDSSKQWRKISDIDTNPQSHCWMKEKKLQLKKLMILIGVILLCFRYHALQNRPFSIAEVRKNMCMYLKNQGGCKMSHFKGISYEEIRPIFERVWDQIQSFVPMDSGKEKGSEKKSRGRRKKSLARKRARETLSKESAKKQKLEDDIEKQEIQVYLNIVLEEESIDIESLATKYPIVD
ncbi:hypothetical protein Tco_0628000 [Tanacetum coccineum]|uniref:Uncharacterized protein n=1 Tax=Tanacetum coccineum TaxID=301880 RepID=A0ABQ4WP85_9ASTR